MNLWNWILRGLWVVEDPADGGPIRHAWLHLTSSWFYPILLSSSVVVMVFAVISHGSLTSMLALHAIAYTAIFRFWYDRNPERRAAKRRARKARRKREHTAQRS